MILRRSGTFLTFSALFIRYTGLLVSILAVSGTEIDTCARVAVVGASIRPLLSSCPVLFIDLWPGQDCGLAGRARYHRDRTVLTALSGAVRCPSPPAE